MIHKERNLPHNLLSVRNVAIAGSLRAKISTQQSRCDPGEVLNPFVDQVAMEMEVVFHHMKQSPPGVVLIDKALDIRFPVRGKQGKTEFPQDISALEDAS